MNTRLYIIALVILVFLSQGVAAAVHSFEIVSQSTETSFDDAHHQEHSQQQYKSSSFDCCKTSMHCSMAGCAVFIPNVTSKIILPSTDSISVEHSLLALPNQHPSSLYRPPIFS